MIVALLLSAPLTFAGPERLAPPGQSIAAEEMLPGLRSPDLDLAPDMEVWTLGPEPHQVAREAVVWEDSTALTHYRFVQRPGPANPLGRVKFVLDNPFAVYLHDTPGTGLFERDERDLSHGCIRVEDAVSLARRLLRHDRSQQTRFDVLLQAGDTGRVELAEPLSTYVMYWTVSVTPGGDTRYLRDLYEVDSRLVAALDRVEGANPWLWPLTGKPTFETGLTP